MNNIILQGDCVDLLKQIDTNSIDLTITSPPYFNVKEYSNWATYEDYLDFLSNVFLEVLRVTKEGKFVCVNISSIIVPRINRQNESKRIALPFHFVNLMEKLNWKFIEDIIWAKPEGASKNRNGGFFQHRQPLAYKPNVINEYIFVFQKPCNFLIDKIVRSYTGEIKEKSLINGEYERTNIWNINPETKSKHLAPYPEELSNKLIQYYSYHNDLVLDPFLGSGTTAISALKNNRQFVGIEIHDEYTKMSQNRIKEELGILIDIK